MQNYHREELLKHLAASLQDAKEQGGAILLVGAGISVSAGIPPAQQLMKIAIENFPNYFTDEEQHLAQDDLGQLQYNDIMTKLSNVKRKELFKWFIEGNSEKGIEKAKLNFAHIAIAELLKQGYFSRILTVNFDPLLIHACYMVGMYPFPAIYDLGAMGKINAELLHDPSIVYLNGQHVGFVQRNTNEQLKAHQETLSQIVRSTGCEKTWVVAGYSGENDPLMEALSELRPFNNWLYWLEYNKDISSNQSHSFLAEDEECKVVNECDADDTFMQIAELLNCSLDFIERPYAELELYLREIKFGTSNQHEHRYISKIKNYIDILKSPTTIKKFTHADQLDALLAYLDDLQSNTFNSAIEEIENQKKIIEICEEISERASNNDSVYWYWGDALFKLAKLEQKDQQKSFLELAESKYLLSIEIEPFEDLDSKCRNLNDLYRYQYFQEVDMNTKISLLHKAIDTLNKSDNLLLEKAKIYALLKDPQLAVSYLEKITFKTDTSSNFLESFFTMFKPSLDDVTLDSDFDNIKNTKEFKEWIKSKKC